MLTLSQTSIVLHSYKSLFNRFCYNLYFTCLKKDSFLSLRFEVSCLVKRLVPSTKEGTFLLPKCVFSCFRPKPKICIKDRSKGQSRQIRFIPKFERVQTNHLRHLKTDQPSPLHLSLLAGTLRVSIRRHSQKTLESHTHTGDKSFTGEPR